MIFFPLHGIFSSLTPLALLPPFYPLPRCCLPSVSAYSLHGYCYGRFAYALRLLRFFTRIRPIGLSHSRHHHDPFITHKAANTLSKKIHM